VYQYNKCTPDVWQHLVDAVQQQGSLAGMLQLKAGPLVHSGYRLAAPADGCDLQHIGLKGSTAPQLVAQLVQQVHAGGQQLWGALPEAPSRPVLLQCAPDLLCADWEQLQQSLAAPDMQQGNALQAAATAVAAAAAAVAAATGRGDDHAAASAAAAAAGAAAAAVSAAQAMGSASAPQPSLAPAEDEGAAAAAEATVSAEDGCKDNSAAAAAAAAAECDEELPATIPDAGNSSVPVNVTVSHHTTAVLPASSAVLENSTSAATEVQLSTSPSAQQLEEAAGLAAVAGAFAAASQPCSSTLRRGAGLLVLLRNGWRGKARPLNGSVLVSGVAYTCYSIVQLMSHEGLLLNNGHQQTVSVRVAAEFLGAGSSSDVVGAWSKQTFSVDVWPEETLLPHCQPPQPVGKQFRSHSSACTHTYEALFGWTPAVITAALGKTACLRVVWHLGYSSCCPARHTC
jgi:hypothetical protein